DGGGSPASEAAEDWRWLVTGYCEQLEQAITEEFRPSPEMIVALQLGLCVDEGVRPPGCTEHLLAVVPNPKWDEWSDREERRQRTQPGVAAAGRGATWAPPGRAWCPAHSTRGRSRPRQPRTTTSPPPAP